MFGQPAQKPSLILNPCVDLHEALRVEFEGLIEHFERISAFPLLVAIGKPAALDTKGKPMSLMKWLSAACGCNECARYDKIRLLLLEGLE